MIYKQCVLKKGNQTQVSGIPEEYAKIGNRLKLRDEDGWVILSVGQNVIPYSNSIIKQHKRNTGDSLPRNRK